jgi:hypothetical protein
MILTRCLILIPKQFELSLCWFLGVKLIKAAVDIIYTFFKVINIFTRPVTFYAQSSDIAEPNKIQVKIIPIWNIVLPKQNPRS